MNGNSLHLLLRLSHQYESRVKSSTPGSIMASVANKHMYKIPQ